MLISTNALNRVGLMSDR